LDATNETAAFNSVPFARPTKVFLVFPDGRYKIIETPPAVAEKDFQKIKIQYTIDQEGNATLEAKYTYFGKAAEYPRRAYKYLSPEQRKKSFERKGIKVNDLKFGSFADTREPFVIELKGDVKNFAQKLDDRLMVLTDVVRLDDYRDVISASPRRYPVLLTSSYYTDEEFVFFYPKGFKIRKIPPPFFLETSFLMRREEYLVKDHVLTIRIRQKSHDHTVGLDSFADFHKIAQELQKHGSRVKNIILEK